MEGPIKVKRAKTNNQSFLSITLSMSIFAKCGGCGGGYDGGGGDAVGGSGGVGVG